MAGRYDFPFEEDSVYAAVRDLVLTQSREGTVVDLGAGWGALAEVCRAHERTYIGCDLEPAGLTALADRGFATHEIDLTDLERVTEVLLKIAADGPIAAILMLDTLEHLPRPELVLELLSGMAADLGSPTLVVSIPNVTHVDLAAKLLLGRWDSTPTGLLDDTHLQLFSSARLDGMMRASGWVEAERGDFSLIRSDQHFPLGLPTLVDGSPLADLVRATRVQAEGHGYVNQFVRAYLPMSGGADGHVVPTREDTCFLSIIVRTRGDRPELLRDLLLCLAAQEEDDFEVLLMVHGGTEAAVSEVGVLVAQQMRSFRERIALIPLPAGGGRSRPLNVGVSKANGSYVAVVDDDDLVIASYVSEFKKLADGNRGKVLRTVVVDQDIKPVSWKGVAGWQATSPFRYAYPPTYQPVIQVLGNFTPFMGLAFPRTVFEDLRISFDEDLPVLEDWDLQLRAIPLVGIASSPVPTAIYHRWQDAAGHSADLHADDEWELVRRKLSKRLDSQPLLLPAGSYSMLQEIYQDLENKNLALAAAWRRQDAAEARVKDLLHSSSWRVTRPLRLLTRLRQQRRAR